MGLFWRRTEYQEIIEPPARWKVKQQLALGACMIPVAATLFIVAIAMLPNFIPRLWLIAILVSAIGIMAFVRARSEWKAVIAAERTAKGLCPVCAYDLRNCGLVCPECGNPNPFAPKEEPPATEWKKDEGAADSMRTLYAQRRARK